MVQQWKPFSLTHITYPILQSSSTHHAPLLALLSLTPPFGICALTTASVFYRDVIAAYLLVGSLLSTLVSSILKRLVRQPRPSRYDSAEGEDEYGMPSNHSCFAWFCAAFLILYVVRRGAVWAASSLPSRCCCSSISTDESMNGNGTTSFPSFAILARIWYYLQTGFTIGISLFVAVGCAYSRVYLGYHTAMQVWAGSIIGTLLGTIWYGLFETEALRQLLTTR